MTRKRTTDTMATMLLLDTDDDALVLTLHDGTVFGCRSPQELWDDMHAILQRTQQRRNALPPGAAREVLEAELVDDDEADRFDHHGAPEGGWTKADVERAATEVADAIEEICAEEWGALGRMFAQGVRRNGRAIHDRISPRTRARRAAKRRLK